MKEIIIVDTYIPSIYSNGGIVRKIFTRKCEKGATAWGAARWRALVSRFKTYSDKSAGKEATAAARDAFAPDSS